MNNFSTSITVGALLSGDYITTLEFIENSAPVTVIRTSARFFQKAKSFYDCEGVHWTMTYSDDFLTGIDNRQFPAEGNVIELIRRDRK